jgi:hypothetical protein
MTNSCIGAKRFSGPVVDDAFVILNALFAWLVNAGYLARNPRSLSRQRRARRSRA